MKTNSRRRWLNELVRVVFSVSFTVSSSQAMNSSLRLVSTKNGRCCRILRHMSRRAARATRMAFVFRLRSSGVHWYVCPSSSAISSEVLLGSFATLLASSEGVKSTWRFDFAWIDFPFADTGAWMGVRKTTLIFCCPGNNGLVGFRLVSSGDGPATGSFVSAIYVVDTASWRCEGLDMDDYGGCSGSSPTACSSTNRLLSPLLLLTLPKSSFIVGFRVGEAAVDGGLAKAKTRIQHYH